MGPDIDAGEGIMHARQGGWGDGAVRRLAGAALGMGLALGLAGCGGDSGTGPDPTPTTVTTTLPTFTFTSLRPGQVRYTDVQINVTGSLSATLDWTFASNDLDIYVTSTSCSVSTTTGIQTLCTAIGRTTSTSSKPERLTVNVTPGNLRVWAANFGPSSESGTLSLTATGR
jgi:hypothetical protein